MRFLSAIAGEYHQLRWIIVFSPESKHVGTHGIQSIVEHVYVFLFEAVLTCALTIISAQS